MSERYNPHKPFNLSLDRPVTTMSLGEEGNHTWPATTTNDGEETNQLIPGGMTTMMTAEESNYIDRRYQRGQDGMPHEGPMTSAYGEEGNPVYPYATLNRSGAESSEFSQANFDDQTPRWFQQNRGTPVELAKPYATKTEKKMRVRKFYSWRE